MLKSHMEAVENSLASIYQVPSNAGHPLHRGSPREAFIREFLQKHLSDNVAIGSGEIIDAKSLPRQSRNQYDIVIYKRNYPKLDFGGGITGFLIESVIATIEVKSLLDHSGIEQSVCAAHNAKNLIPNVNWSFSTGWVPPKVLNYVVAYDGPQHMSTVHGWILNSHRSKNIPLPSFNNQNRDSTPGTSLDGVFLLKKGFLKLNNTPLSFSQQPPIGSTYTISDNQANNLLVLFLALQEACNNIEGAWFDPVPYLHNAKFQNIGFI